MLRLLRRFIKSEKGLAAVEFAFIAPVLGAMLVGTIELCDALQCRQKVASVASSVADLVAQSSKLSTSDISNIYDAANTLVYPFPSSGSTIVISSIISDGNGNGVVAWSQAQNGSPLTAGHTMSIPSGIMDKSICATRGACSVIFAQVTYHYTSPLGRLIVGSVSMKDFFYARPHQSVVVTCTDCSPQAS